MADNLVHIIEHELPGTRFVLWGYDGWIATIGAVGSRMKEEFGEGYYAVGLTFHQGSYQTRIVAPGEPAGELRAAVAPAAPVGSLSWYFSRANVGNFFLDIRGAASADSVVQQWLATPQERWLNGWGYREPGLSALRLSRAAYDGMIFIETSTPTRPTPNAIRSAGNRERL
jgi:erythromycin esterase